MDLWSLRSPIQRWNNAFIANTVCWCSLNVARKAVAITFICGIATPCTIHVVCVAFGQRSRSPLGLTVYSPPASPDTPMGHPPNQTPISCCSFPLLPVPPLISPPHHQWSENTNQPHGKRTLVLLLLTCNDLSHFCPTETQGVTTEKYFYGILKNNLKNAAASSPLPWSLASAELWSGKSGLWPLFNFLQPLQFSERVRLKMPWHIFHAKRRDFSLALQIWHLSQNYHFPDIMNVKYFSNCKSRGRRKMWNKNWKSENEIKDKFLYN